MSARAGIGFDSHRLAPARRLVLGGVEVPEAECGLDGHSDADVLTHAVIDALLGAAALGDIGAHFPDTDERWRDADSLRLLREVVRLLGAKGWAIVNLDATVVCERPRLGHLRDAMRAALAEAAGLRRGSVSVKFTTAERMGALGRAEGIAALATASIERAAGGAGGA